MLCHDLAVITLSVQDFCDKAKVLGQMPQGVLKYGHGFEIYQQGRTTFVEEKTKATKLALMKINIYSNRILFDLTK